MENTSADIASRARRLIDRVNEAAVRAGRNPEDVKLMAVTKTMDANQVNEAIGAGISLLGENRAQELATRYNRYSLAGCQVHFIGHLQRNKLSSVLPLVNMIESLDSIRLAEAIGDRMQSEGKVMDCLVEINIGNEKGKTGVYVDELWELLPKLAKIEAICIRGLMVIPPVGEILKTEGYFCNAHQLFIDIKAKKMDNIYMDFLSMGMSSDFELAIKHGSHIVRLGRSLFGERSATFGTGDTL